MPIVMRETNLSLHPQLFFDCDEILYKLSVTDGYRLKLVRVLSRFD